MKSLLLSIKPEHALNILSGNKTLELRKKVPKDFVGWVYGYVTKGKPYLYINDPFMQTYERFYISRIKDTTDDIQFLLNGTISFRFWFDEYEKLDVSYSSWVYAPNKNETTIKNLCLSEKQIEQYSWNGGIYKDLYAWHIKKLEIFDEPMQLSDFENYMSKTKWQIFHQPLTKAPQSFQFVWIKEEIK